MRLPGVRARLGTALPVLAAGCVALVPLTTRTGQYLQGQLGGGGPLVERHAALGDRVLPWTVGLLVLSLLVWWRGRTATPAAREADITAPLAGARGEARTALLVLVAITVVCAAVAAGAVVSVVRAGDSGARAAWDGVVEG